MTEQTEQTTQTKGVRLIGQAAIEYAKAHTTTLKCVGKEGMAVFVPAMEEADPEAAQDMVDNGVSADLFYCDADPRIVALAKHLDCHPSHIEEARYGDNTYTYGRREFRVLTDEEADEAVAESIKSSLWAFNASFISSHTKKGLSSAAEKALSEAQAKLCEDANDLVEAMIDDLDHFVDDAVAADGRGHFLAQYDGEEQYYTVGGVTYYVYRNN